MHRVGGWLGYKQADKGSTQSLDSLDEAYHIEDAMKAAHHILNDDVETAEAELNKGSSPFHKLGKGVVIFIKATLGFEQDIMREAFETLADAESSALENQRRVLRKPHSYHSPIYPIGTEYALCNATAQLMGAVVCVLNESLTESIRGFYKLRKAYVTLDGILQAEAEYIKKQQDKGKSVSSESFVSVSGADLEKPKGLPETAAEASPSKKAGNDDDDEFVDADESLEGVATPSSYTGHLQPGGDESKGSSGKPSTTSTPDEKQGETRPDALEQLGRAMTNVTVKDGPSADIFGEHPIDTFIHSCSNLCFGMLMLMMSLIPPAFATLLKIVGFRGDRDRGISMLWQASKFPNVFGGMAGLLLFVYYNNLVGFCDIIPPNGPGSYPTDRLNALLVEMRKRYPKSQFWLIEEASMLAAERKLEDAVTLLKEAKESDLRQILTLQWFERSMESMYLHDYEETCKGFQKCVEYNNWSHGVYHYITACAHLELYRKNKSSNSEEAKKQAKLAEDFFKLVPKSAGKKKFMSRPLPFDVFINRKVQKWEARAKAKGVAFIDAIGVSPLEEMIYFWNGYKRMGIKHLEQSLENLDWITKESPGWEEESIDEKSIHYLLKASALRNLGRISESKEVLLKNVLPHDWNEFKGNLKDNWTAPCARYEMASNLWVERNQIEDVPANLAECSKYLEEVAKWEAYDLDARIGLKVATARETLRRVGIVPKV